MRFAKKSEVLKHLGKNPNDNKLIDRMIIRGDIRVENGMYELIDRDSILVENEALRKKIKNLSERVSELEYELENAQPSVDYSDVYKKIYAYLKQVLHINVSYDDLVEFVENYPSD